MTQTNRRTYANSNEYRVNANGLFAEMPQNTAKKQVAQQNVTTTANDHFKESLKKDLVSDGKDKEGLFFSKAIVIVSLIMFILVLLKVFTMETPDNGYLATVYVGAITGSSALAVTTVVWYLKKTHTAYVAKVETQLYKDTIGIQYTYTVGLMQKQRDFNLTDQQMNKIENAISAKNVSNSVFSEAQANIKTSKSEGTATIKKETGA